MTLREDYEDGVDVIHDTDVNAWTAAINDAYVKPVNGIPSSDMATAVQTSLASADSALQTVASTDISDATTTGEALITATDAAAARTAIGATTTGEALVTATDAAAGRTAIGAGTSNLVVGTTGGTACEGNDSRLSDARTPTAAGQVADISMVIFSKDTTRAASSYGDFPFGIKLQRAITFTSVTFRVATADASGNLVVELRKNGAQVSGTSTSIAAANQVAGGTSTGTWAFAVGDIITGYITGVGTTPGKGLIADVTGLTT